VRTGITADVTKRDFSLFTGLLKTARTDDGLILSGIASSTIKDRHGDTMTANALKSMLESADGMTIYLNHEYKVPEDVAGTVRRAWIEKASDDLHDLHFEIGINEENPRAVQAFNAIDKGTKLGLSIGAMIPEGGAKRNKSNGAYIIDDVELLETSIVSIPANPRSWVEYARKSLMTKSDIPEIEDDDEPVVEEINGNEDDPETSPEVITPENLTLTFASLDMPLDIIDSAGTHPHAHTHDHEHEHGWGDADKTVHSHDHAHIHSHEHDAEHEHDDSQNDWAHNHSHNDADKEHAHTDGGSTDTQKATVTVWPSGKVSVNTTPPTPSQDATPQADPETEESSDALSAALGEMSRDITPEIKDLLGPTVMASLQSSQQLTLALVVAVEKATERATKAEGERDEVIKAAKVLTETTEAFIARVAATPRGRRAISREAPETAKALEGIRESGLYSEEFLDILQKGVTA